MNATAGSSRQDRLVYGCMRLAGDGSRESEKIGRAAVHAALEAGYRLFDHADIYGGGRCESLFGALLRERPALRDELKITSKCGVRFAGDPTPTSPKRYDLSKRHITESVNGSLTRLNVETLDTLLLHRPDYLFDAHEISEAFMELHRSGKVRAFGVSNFSTSQVARLQETCPYELTVNQVELNLENLTALEDGTLDQCLQLSLVPEIWSPLRGITYSSADTTLTGDIGANVRRELERQSQQYGCESWLIVLAWLLEHPAGLVPLIGTVKPDRIAAARKALDITYDREDWYRLFAARRGYDVP